jgi:hypothetical protein
VSRSAEHVFSRLGRESPGWLFIDEAGQADKAEALHRNAHVRQKVQPHIALSAG